MTVVQLQLTDYRPPGRSRRGEPVAAFVLLGAPQPWARPKPFVRGGRVTEAFSGPYARWRKKIIAELTSWWAGRGELRPVRVPLIVYIEAVYPRPATPPEVTISGEVVPYPWTWTSGRNPALVVGDVDNMAKAVLDAAQRAGAGCGPLLGDDRWVVDLRVVKVYAAIAEEPRTEVRLWRAA